ncbi:MAG: DUF3987 domain-containing protein [Verrucomicrobia bacterium]|nr:DUF3987 domain-containing protein [Verrucomicrobiota bacterium]
MNYHPCPKREAPDAACRMLRPALHYASHGWPIFPCKPDKRPATGHGFKDATCERKTIIAWWTANPAAMIGMPTGAVSKIIAVDLDRDAAKGLDGVTAFAALVNSAGASIRTRKHRTPRGGVHLLFAHHGEAVKNSASAIAPGVDTRGSGGYIVLPPSRTETGEYRVEDDADPTPLPPWLCDLLRERKVMGSPDVLAERSHYSVPATPGIASLAPYVQAAVEAETSAVAATLTGQRNGALNKAAFNLGQLVGSGALVRADAEAALMVAARRCGLPDQESARTIKSGLESGQKDPRQIPDPKTNPRQVRGKPLPTLPEQWPAPQPIPDELVPVQKFDYSLLPATFRPWIQDIADRLQCPPDFSAVAAIVAIAAVVGRKVGIRPKQHDDWLVIPNIWGAAIGRAGVMKSPAIAEPLKPLTRLEIEAAKQHKEAIREHEAILMLSKQRRFITENRIKEILKDAGGRAAAMKLARQAIEEEGCEPIRKRYIVNDSTVEKHGELLRQNPNGYLVHRDELIGLLKSLDKDGQEGSRAFYLEAWNGTGRFTYDRIGRGTIDVESVIFSVMGGITPGPLGDYLRQAVGEGALDDGLMQRFQLAVWPDISREWHNVDRWPDSEAKQTAYAVFKRLDRLDPKSIGAQTDANGDGIPYLHFMENAQEIFNEWRGKLEAKIRTGDEHRALESHLAKYRSLIPSLALLFHLVDDGRGAVTDEALQCAIRWGDYLESHARRIFAVAISPDIPAAKALAKRLLNGDLKDEFSLKDVYRPCWSGLNTRELAQAAADALLDLNWLAERRETAPGAFKPSTIYQINPKVRNIPCQGTAITAITGSNGSKDSDLYPGNPATKGDMSGTPTAKTAVYENPDEINTALALVAAENAAEIEEGEL